MRFLAEHRDERRDSENTNTEEEQELQCRRYASVAAVEMFVDFPQGRRPRTRAGVVDTDLATDICHRHRVQGGGAAVT